MISIPKNIITFDTETTGTNPYGDPKLLGFHPARPYLYSFTNLNGESFSLRFEVDPFTRRVIPNLKYIKIIKSILEDKRIVKVGHNIGFDILMSKMFGIQTLGKFEDTLALAHIATGGSELTYALKPFCKRVMGYDDIDEKDLRDSVISARHEGKSLGWYIADGKVFGKDPIKCDYWLGDKDLCQKYCENDTERTMLLYIGFRDKVRSNPGMERTYIREKLLMPITWRMEQRGTRVFPDKLKEVTKYYEEHKKKYLIVASLNGGKDLNFNSPKQLQEHFYGEKQYEVLKRTKPTKNNPSGNPSTDGDTLVYFVERYNDKLAKAIIEYTGADQMITGFMEPYQRFKSFENGCWVLHPNFKQVGPVTGRYACGDPNLQQVAADDSGKKKANIQLRPRECLGPRDGYVWYLPDYSQIEVWVPSFISQEPSLMNLLLSGRDFHEEISRTVWGSNPDFEEKISFYRKRAKNINFGKIFGAGIAQIAKLIGSSYQEASKFVYEYDTKNPAIARFMNRMSNRMIQEGRLVNPFGRHYFLPPNVAYKGTNYMVQGTAADILKRAMIRIHKNLYPKYIGMEMLLTIHDELVIEVPKKHNNKQTIRDIVNAMGADHKVIGCPIPLPIGMKITSTTWAEAKEVAWVKQEWRNKYICSRKK